MAKTEITLSVFVEVCLFWAKADSLFFGLPETNPRNYLIIFASKKRALASWEKIKVR